MMTNLFSIFDPCNFMLSSSWLIPMIGIMSPILILTSKSNLSFKKIINSITSEYKTLTNNNIMPAFLIPLFISILIFNLISMIPTTFMMTTQASVVIPIAASMWLMNIMYFLVKKTNSLLIHMVPQGSPTLLMPIMVMIELISNLIRPITLSVRLIANITAGHLLMHLLSSYVCSIMPNSPVLSIMIPASFILTILELAVGFIQSYIMCTLLALYSSEIH